MGASEREHGVRWLGGGLKGWTEAADWRKNCFFFQMRRRKKKTPRLIYLCLYLDVFNMVLEGYFSPAEGGSFLVPMLTLSWCLTAVAAVAPGRIVAKAGQM